MAYDLAMTVLKHPVRRGPVTVATLLDGVSAAVVQSRLEAVGIRSVVVDGILPDIAWNLSLATGGVKVQVAGGDAEAARAVLATATQPLAETEPWPERLPGDARLDRALRVALIGLLCVPFQGYALWLLARAVGTDAGGRRWWRCGLVVVTCVPLLVWLAWWLVGGSPEPTFGEPIKMRGIVF